FQNTTSVPDSSFQGSSRIDHSSSWSYHDIFCHLPPTSFIGVFSRCSPCPCSRAEAPLAQCAPKFNGESNTGSCLTHTPFSTTASIEQPTEQWVHTVRCTSRATFAVSSAACAFVIVP